jgi:hypothetical protein
MMKPVKHYNDYSLTEGQLKRYQDMPMEKRLEWLYLGNLLRKAFCEMMDKEPFDVGKQVEGQI